ncbi:hypothetical protein GLYMA_16G142750v4 [Glycine max]|nr:hypothetical protein GLYMA_16G142750v4 [Glycine max]KAH1151402.1 hypothetical protein GYH30_045084 [Glycine max]
MLAHWKGMFLFLFIFFYHSQQSHQPLCLKHSTF